MCIIIILYVHVHKYKIAQKKKAIVEYFKREKKPYYSRSVEHETKSWKGLCISGAFFNKRGPGGDHLYGYPGYTDDICLECY